MEQNYFEILLEQFKHQNDLLTEWFAGTNQRLDRVDGRLDGVEGRLDRVEVKLVVFDQRFKDIDQRFNVIDQHLTTVEKDLGEVKADVRDIKRTSGLLHPIANDHETRIQSLENTVKDHLTRHS